MLIAAAEDKEISRDEMSRHFSIYSERCNKDSLKLKTQLALAACALLQKDYSKSDQFLEQLIDKQSSKPNPLLWFAVGLKNQKIKKFKSAIDSFNLSISQNLILKRKSFLVHIKLIECYIFLRNYNDAILHFTLHYIEIPSEYQPKLLCSIGYCYEQINNKEKAIVCYTSINSDVSSFTEIALIWSQILQKNLDNLLDKINNLFIKSLFYINLF